MGTFIKAGEMIEGQKCYVVARKQQYKRGGLKKDPITNKNMSLYKLDRNISVEVTETLSMNEEQRGLRDSLGVHYQIGDTLEAYAVRLYVDSYKNDLRFVVKEGVTGRHGASLVTTNKRTIGVIKTPLKMLDKVLKTLDIDNKNKQIETKKKV